MTAKIYEMPVPEISYTVIEKGEQVQGECIEKVEGKLSDVISLEDRKEKERG